MRSRYRWYVAAVMFLFLLLHQADKLLIGPLTTAIMEDFQNVIATIFDTTVPEVRSTARALQKLVEDGGAALALFLAGVIAMRASLHTAILVICISAWLACAILFGVTALVVPRDIDRLRHTMQQRVQEMGHSGT